MHVALLQRPSAAPFCNFHHTCVAAGARARGPPAHGICLGRQQGHTIALHVFPMTASTALFCCFWYQVSSSHPSRTSLGGNEYCFCVFQDNRERTVSTDHHESIEIPRPPVCVGKTNIAPSPSPSKRITEPAGADLHVHDQPHATAGSRTIPCPSQRLFALMCVCLMLFSKIGREW